MRQPTTKVLVVYDVQVKTPEVSQIPLIINYGEGHRSVGRLPSLTPVRRSAESGRRVCTPVRFDVLSGSDGY